MRIVQWKPAARWAALAMVGCATIAAVVASALAPASPARRPTPELTVPETTFVDVPGGRDGDGCHHVDVHGVMLRTGSVLRTRARVGQSIRIYRGWPVATLHAMCDTKHRGDGCYLDAGALVFNYYLSQLDSYERLVVPLGAPLSGSFDRDYDAVLTATPRRVSDVDRWPFTVNP
jgi:hypothetical protein